MSTLKNHKARAHALLSASSSDRWLKCPPSAVAATLYPDADTAYTREGTLAHEVAEALVRGKEPELVCAEFADVTPEMVRCAESYADYIAEQLQSADAVVLLEQRLDFSPWVPDGFGTGDCIIIQGSRLDVIDYKYGQGVEVSAVGNTQMRLYGLGALNDYGDIYDIEEVVLHIFQPRKNNTSVERISKDELLLWGEVVKPLAAQAYAGKGRHCAGPHCRWCPHAGSCPTLAKFCSEKVKVNGSRVDVQSLAPFQVADILAAEPIISAWLSAVKDRAYAALMNGEEVPGYKLVAGKSRRTWADELEVAQVLDAAGVAREDYTVTEVLSPAKMEKALGKAKTAELLGGHILSTPGAPTVAPASDKRPAYDRLAETRNDFK